jgi:hypothetical protein
MGTRRHCLAVGGPTIRWLLIQKVSNGLIELKSGTDNAFLEETPIHTEGLGLEGLAFDRGTVLEKGLGS